MKFIKENKIMIGVSAGLLVLVFLGYTSNSAKLSVQNTTVQPLQDEILILKKQNKELKTQISKDNKYVPGTSFVQFADKELMKDIIITYKGISNRVKKEIIETVLGESRKYKINPLILYSLIHTESSMRPWIEHKQTTVTVNKKKIKVKAVGLGGVVWEWWGDKLRAAEIAEVRSDLFDPTINVRSTAFIYNELFKLKKHPKAKSQDESAMIRYFGGGYKWYFERIDKKIAELIKNRLYRSDIDITDNDTIGIGESTVPNDIPVTVITKKIK